ncbi:major egg antigen-like [Anoplophora glabripennis]|uniref:major egg antigen-like n=1 Tax=Anoplophora glabripennis TaxID=217634 RepID=UPI000C78767E|nr:major egg antigen-like [Anoplophora glabripennis]
MSLLPFFDDSYLLRPSRLLNQHFGLPLEPEDILGTVFNPRLSVRCPAGYVRNWLDEARDVGSTVSFDKDKFQANVDVQQFKPEEISVKVTGDNTVTIEGKHEEKQDEHGSISRHFVRRYVLPQNCDINQVQSKLSSDGVLTITAPKVNEDKSIQQKEIPIIRTGEPLKKVEQKKEEQKNECEQSKQHRYIHLIPLCPAGYIRNWIDEVGDVGSTVNFDKNKFQANVDIQQFKPEEISVKITGDNTVTIEGKHEEKQDEHGYISRHFVRRYVLPQNCDINQVQSKLSSDGVLTITAPKVDEDKSIQQREIPIIRTGEPLKRVEQKKRRIKNEP